MLSTAHDLELDRADEADVAAAGGRYDHGLGMYVFPDGSTGLFNSKWWRIGRDRFVVVRGKSGSGGVADKIGNICMREALRAGNRSLHNGGRAEEKKVRFWLWLGRLLG
jgi:hypothetical protein